jgi:hypothetical protein
MSGWPSGPGGPTPPPSPLLRSASWLTTVLGAMLALLVTPFVFREVESWGVFEVMASDVYGDGFWMGLIRIGFAVGLFGAVVLAARLVGLGLLNATVVWWVSRRQGGSS